MRPRDFNQGPPADPRRQPDTAPPRDVRLAWYMLLAFDAAVWTAIGLIAWWNA